MDVSSVNNNVDAMFHDATVFNADLSRCGGCIQCEQCGCNVPRCDSVQCGPVAVGCIRREQCGCNVPRFNADLSWWDVSIQPVLALTHSCRVRMTARWEAL